ncbi:mRNA decapping complex subunit 2 [Psilocybe cubensis]|uniref:Nudix hydrolase domain-containing protein n=2 Tax=Psilocybe cubensis TaxID=181762 RepID=A0A8H8CQU2_PSICU|nr:mRNA decapping complex subunit 2 [Psilocybe cubensis]KAH9486943.1 mRNA decapping complex subunit 2 [Psilocybe cubensis]
MASSSSSSPEISSAEPVRFSYKNASEEEVLDDLSSRFILNLPDEELASLERLCFQVEQAHWFYEDFIREENNNLPSYNLKRFSETLFKACPLLQQWSHDHEQAFSTFMQYKTRVPVCGAIMLNDAMDKCVLVKGWKASSGWGFPKGKINEDEHPRDCAVREVLEETGYNLASQIDAGDFFEMSIKEQKICLFVVPGVPEDFPFKTKTRKEISKIEWFRLVDLPTWKKKQAAPGKFYLITPFINPLKKFISQRKPRKVSGKNGKQKNAQSTVSSSKGETSSQRSDPAPEPNSQSTSEENQTSSSRQPESTETTDPAQMDPQLARLLFSLAKSATISPGREDESAKPIDNASQSTSLLPIHNSDASEESPVVTHTHEHQDWSSSVPSYEPQANLSDQLQQSQAFVSAPAIAAVSPPSNELPPKTTVNGSTSDNSQTVSFPSTKETPSALSSPTSNASPTSRRKSSSTADISPYLSRQAEVPTSAKMLKQLSLLEAVADESARMAPIIAARAAMASRGPIPGGYPIPSASVPPQHVPVRESNAVYSYQPGLPPPPASAAGFHPRYPMENQINNYQDPFQVRSRTSQAFHRGPMHNPTGSVSMNQNHLLAAISGSRAGPISPHYQMGPQFIQQQQQHQMFNTVPPPPHYGPPNPTQFPHHPAHPPMNGYNMPPPPPPPLPSSIRPYPSTNANPIPVVNTAPIAQNPTSVSLLSILNGRPVQQSTIPGPAHQ